ncbi:MAG: type I-E CRISPR-associated protein Cas7/Cse4/CasC [Planctomycetes bacterium]|nr:type I-E CRISPR-associated protein Cas7/Cse4/CasC [Planctomycetota bacterium]
MSKFIQLHLLTSYPPSNPNRDDLGRPKTAVIGGATRLRISSQSLKRAWRDSDLFSEALKGHKGTRTKEMGVRIYNSLVQKGVKEAKAIDWAKKIAGQFGKLKGKKKDDPMEELRIEQLAHFSPEEEAAIQKLIDKLASKDKEPSDDAPTLLRKEHSAADIAMFGRMLASSPKFNTEAAVQVAHAITVHKVAVEDDFFTAVDDLNREEDITGAGHMGETEFSAGLFYLYICIDRDLLVENLSGNKTLSGKTLSALVEAAAKVTPGGKQNSFGSRAYASYILAEKGNQQPRSLSVAFLKPVQDRDLLPKAIENLEDTRARMDKVYGSCADSTRIMNAQTAEGSLKEIIEFILE